MCDLVITSFACGAALLSSSKVEVQGNWNSGGLRSSGGLEAVALGSLQSTCSPTFSA
jgi:hypothetical protein